MRSLLLAGLLSSTIRVNAHPVHETQPGLSRRTVDLNNFRLAANSKYINATKISTEENFQALKSENYVDTATELVKTLLPDATFRVVQDYYVGTNGIAHVNFKQTIHDLDVDNGDFNVNIGKDGQVFSYGYSFYTGAVPATNPLVKRDFVDPVNALHGAVNLLQLPVTAEGASAEPTGATETFTLKGTSGATKDPEARLMYLQTPEGELKLIWRVETDILSNWLLSYVDANTNERVHAVVDWSADATYQVYPWGINDPSEGSRISITDPWDISASPFTWQSDGTNYTVTRGNNGIAQTNPSGGSSYLNNPRPSSSTLNFTYSFSLTDTTPTNYANASVTQLFYTANHYHDLLYELGFTEAAGNFQTNNNGKGGVGNDLVILNSQDGSGTNNANFATPADGSPGRMRMYLWNKSTPQRDGCFEAGVVIHEYTHGLSNRLTGGPSNVNCLSSTEAGGMGEGWGDFMATAIRLKAGDTRATNYGMGSWVSNSAGIRAYLYSTSLTTNPYVYTSANSLNEVHAIGTIWATMLYEVLWNLIDKYGNNMAERPTFSNGVPTDGKYLTMKLVVDAMALQPCNPNFVQARDAILDADKNLTGGQNLCAIWTAFAKRGLGSGAAYNSGSRTGSTVIPSGVC